MGAGEEEDTLAILALAEVESASTFKVGSLQGRDGEAESGSKGFAELRDGVVQRVEREHLWASDRASDDGLTEANLEVAKASLSQ